MYGGSIEDNGVELTALLLGNPEIIESFDFEFLPENGIDAGQLCNDLGLSANTVLYSDKDDQSQYRGLYEVGSETVTLWWQGAFDNSLQDNYATYVDEETYTEGRLGWRVDTFKYIFPDFSFNGEWIAQVGNSESEDETTGFTSQLEALEFAGVDQSKLLKTYELEAEWDEMYSFWVSQSEQSTSTFKSSFFGRSNKVTLAQ
ncbi:hypothetical protein JCM19232_3661 [Vibrio ishigakensis]|uniref:Uncharacterized protein n=1 Tax=Vibrio ishigakensis TaxID=1481914 RepID=A0A0B8PCV2_9VIBR|nr:hypothetical protein JCM19232_3661 [Vibrio ishigakensis]